MKRLTVVFLVLVASVLLSACAGGPSSTSWPGLTADKDNAYLANGSFLYAVRLSDAAKAWQYPVEKPGKELFYSDPVLTPDGQLLVASAGPDNSIVSLNPSTGQPTWGQPFTAPDHWIAAPLVVGDTIYAPNNNGTLYAIKLATGQLDWSLPVGRELWATPTTDGKLIFITSLDHFLYAVDPATRKVAWKVDLGGSVPGSPALASDSKSLYIGSFARKLYAIDPANGGVRWTTELKDWVWGTPALLGDSLYAADISGNVYALAAASGKNGWPDVKPDGPITSNMIALPDGGVVVAVESGSLYAYKADGSILWSVVIPNGKIYTSPVLAGDRILVAPMGAEYWLYAVNIKDGSLAPWHFNNK